MDNENGGNTNINVVAGFPWALPRTVDLGYSGTATKVVDYTLTPSEDVVLAPFALTGRTTIRSINDSIDEPNETVIVSVLGVSNGEIAQPGSLPPVTIIDDDLPILPEISVSPATHDFGSVLVSGGSKTATFTVKNEGTAPLNLTGNPRVLITGANAADFSVVQQPPASVGPMAEVSFSVTFDALAVGARQATIEIANNDGDENPVRVSLTGTGLSTIPGTGGNDTISVIRSGLQLLIYVNAQPVGQPTHLIALAAVGPSLIIDTLGGNDSLVVDTGGEANLGVALLNYTAGAGANTLSLIGGGARIDSTAVGGALNSTVQSGAQLSTSRLMQNGLALADNSQAILLSGGATSLLTGLTLGTGARLDITNNALVVNYTGSSPVAMVRDKILSGRGGPGLGQSWNGPGIISSTAAQANLTAPESRSVGYAENALLPLGSYSTFRGQAVDDTSVLIAYTRTADVDLNGVVNDDDVTIIGAKYSPGVSQPAWAFGDFEYNGFVDDDDVTLLGALFDRTATPVLTSPLREARDGEFDPASQDRRVFIRLDLLESVFQDGNEARRLAHGTSSSLVNRLSRTRGLHRAICDVFAEW